MNIKELLAVVDKGWIRKPKGFRVHFEKWTPEGPVTDFMPGTDSALMDSDVVAWRSAWKLFQATQSDDPEFGDGRLANIYVVDEDGRPVKNYATGRYDIYNRRPGSQEGPETSLSQESV